MKLTDEHKLTIIGLLAAVIVGSLVYAYNHFLVPSTPSEILDKPEKIFEKRPHSGGLKIHISGAVRREGVYVAKIGDRVVDLVTLAGGSLPNADLSALNLAEEVKDGQKVVIPVKEYQSIGASEGRGSGDQKSRKAEIGKKININTASLSELDELPGVGPATAQKIIDARPFSKPEDITKIPRFSKNKFDKLKDRICL
ncbi:ComEA family DNA-binding protein [Candidatus Saganbacteria bacterium]|nr:ComEA family DNA-binding protein [Candidatus Saganbacteria bacterium]